jgi:hypothetical protein
MFEWKKSNSYSVPSRITHILATDAEVYSTGEALALVSGRWTKASNGGQVAGICQESKTAGVDDSLEVLECRADDVFEAPYTGVPAAGFVVGANTADISADGLSVLSSDVTGGAFSVLSINTNKTTCKVKVKNRQLS